jgi:hypothetical protein
LRVGVAVTLTTLAGYGASVLVTALVGTAAVGDAFTGEALLTVLVVSLSTGAAVLALALPGLLLFTRWFVGRVQADQSLAQTRYSRSAP